MMRSTKQNHHRGAEKQRNRGESGFLLSVPVCLCGYIHLRVFRAFRGSISFLMVLVLFTAFSDAAPALAQTPEEQSAAVARTQKVAALLSSAQGPASEKAPRIAKENGGYVRHVGFPRGRGIEAPGADAQNPRDVAEKFLSQWRDAFVNPSEKVNFAVGRALAHRGRSYVRVQQKYGGLRIFDADLNIQVDADGRVNSLLCNVMRDTGVLDRGELSTSPTLTAEAAQETARQAVVQLFSDTASTATLPASTVTLHDLTASPPELLLFHPSAVGRKGPTRLVWSTVVQHFQEPLVEERILVDAHTGEIPLHFPLFQNAKYREIYDKNGAGGYDLGALEREEGDPECGINAVDLGYLFFGEIYDQNWDWHSLDSYDNAGHHITVSVRWGVENAGWHPDLEHIFMGTNFLFDDVAMHEYTHGVSDLLMELEYLDESAALSESFSDMWGEWFDQEHNYVNRYGYTNHDGEAYDWLVNEDYTGSLPPEIALRNMKDPPAIGHSSDRYRSPNWDNYSDPHYRSGVGNKLCYLLTAGDTFNGFAITAADPVLHYSRIAMADLFYEARVALNAYSGYHALYIALTQSAVNQGYSDAQKLNLEKACQAVSIRNSSGGLTLKNTSGVKVGMLEDSGQLLLKKTLTTQAQSPINTSDGGLIVRNDAGTVVAFINASAGENGGQTQILGSLTQNDLPSASGNLLVVRYEGVPVTTLDANGNLKIWREADDNNDAVEEPHYLE